MKHALTLTLIAAMLIAGCKREPKPATLKRPPGAVGPSSEEIAIEHRRQLLTELEPIPPLGEGIVYKAPDGEEWTRFSNGLMIRELIPSAEAIPRFGQKASIAYVGTFPDGKVFDSKPKSDPLEFTLGTKTIIKGMSMAVSTMHVGGRRRVFIPPDLAYGPGGDPMRGIPANQALIFEIDLIRVTGDAIELGIEDMPKIEQLGPALPTTAPATAPAK